MANIQNVKALTEKIVTLEGLVTSLFAAQEPLQERLSTALQENETASQAAEQAIPTVDGLISAVQAHLEKSSTAPETTLVS